ncbi:Glutathione peroxidase-like peroxiredoxin 2 [Erysiphe necator]|uniref:Glutathione peroxidase n=1 Tax=Uncinula necator TaxID=52586 RepID=A0A0B1P313_UNCNE|nr:Glutathione peroxidase-like peroxiredoxin 2 [Erysiphe necator]KHJ32673.1 putative glutathione peroxidase [Erysiphe necator]
MVPRMMTPTCTLGLIKCSGPQYLSSAILRKSRPALLPRPSQLIRPFSIQYRTMQSAKSFYDFQVSDAKGQPQSLSQYKDKVVLVVNTASKCGFTPQLQGLEKLYESVNKAHPDKFVILGFPCNQFGSQDPGSNEEIQDFCRAKYNVTFPVLGKVEVKGDNAEPLFKWLTEEKPGIMGIKFVKWNFEKWLISKDGKAVKRWASTASPESLEKNIVQEILK